MTNIFQQRPSSDEYFEFYDTYISKVPPGSVIDTLRDQASDTIAFLETIPEERAGHSYEDGKWTVSQVVGHVVDTEWVFTQRALWFARGDRQPLPGMEQDDWVREANHRNRSLDSLITEFRHLRAAGVACFEGFDRTILDRRGTASECSFSVRACIFIVAGHARHHMQVLRERYM
jgi:hypothetical protein